MSTPIIHIPRPAHAVLAALYETDAEPVPEDAAILQSLMNAGHADRVEFMSG